VQPAKINYGSMTRLARERFCAAIRQELPENIPLQPGIKRYNAIAAKILA
jgi:hypothetical protein